MSWRSSLSPQSCKHFRCVNSRPLPGAKKSAFPVACGVDRHHLFERPDLMHLEAAADGTVGEADLVGPQLVAADLILQQQRAPAAHGDMIGYPELEGAVLRPMSADDEPAE